MVAYAPSAATKPSIAILPLNFSASGVIVLRFVIGVEFKETFYLLKDSWYDPTSKSIVNCSNN